jgi:hypothetical protein
MAFPATTQETWMSALAEARSAFEADIALWKGVEEEWRTPKGDLTAYFVRQNAKSRREDAETALAKIGQLEASSVGMSDADIESALRKLQSAGEDE